jgi:hypothetical protein
MIDRIEREFDQIIQTTFINFDSVQCPFERYVEALKQLRDSAASRYREAVAELAENERLDS